MSKIPTPAKFIIAFLVFMGSLVWWANESTKEMLNDREERTLKIFNIDELKLMVAKIIL